MESDPNLSNAGLDPAPNRSGRAKNSVLDRAVLESCGSLRRSPRTATGFASEKRPWVEVDDDEGDEGCKKKYSKKSKKSRDEKEEEDFGEDLGNVNGSSYFVGDPVPEEDAKEKWPHRYAKQVKMCNSWSNIANTVDDDDIILKVKCHYLHANVSGCTLDVGDCAYVKGEKGKPNYVGRILEFFETIRGEYYVQVQWFFRAEDTVMKDQAACHDKKRLFYSDLVNDNLLDCIVSKVRVVQVPPSIPIRTDFSSPLKNDVEVKPKILPSCYYYYDMKYSVDYSTFQTMEMHRVSDDLVEKNELSASNCSGTDCINDIELKSSTKQQDKICEQQKTELSLLDLYSGCGGMSTGLCLGAQVADVKLIARWAIDFDEDACESLQLNHPETHVRNEAASDFYELLKEWDILCKKYRNSNSNVDASKKDREDDSESESEEYEVSRLVDICYGDPSKSGERGLKFKVRWKGYHPNEDTWEPIDNLSNCEDRIQDFVKEGLESKLLPRPGDVDVVCGGPPCQGISGYNRFRNFDAPLDDERNRQIAVFLDIVQFLKPKYVLMENVCDLLKFAKGTLARYALSRLVYMNYQARLGMMAAGCYGLPQFRLRVFLWGCQSSEKLPQFPLPTHEVILKGGAPVEFERNVVGYEEGQPRELEKALVLEDVLSDLPVVTNQEVREQMPYEKGPQTEFQKYIRAPKSEMLGSTTIDVQEIKSVLYDHRPKQLAEDDYMRVCRIPRRKGANFRDLPGVIVAANNTVHLDPTMERELLPSGKALIPDWTMTFWEGKSVRPYSRLWWDEIVPTVLTVPDTHSQTVLHPEQDRVLTIRESARVQGFPDHYQFCGTVKKRYRQIGNAVAVPVGKALGYALGLALLKQSGDDPIMTLPPKFSHNHKLDPSTSSSGVQ